MIVVLLLVCVAPALGQLLPLLSISDGKSYSFTGLSLHNQGSSAPGVPNATVLFADVYGGLSVYNVDAFVNDAPPVVTPLWNTVYPGENVSVTTGHAARHVGALDKGAGVPTKPAQPDFIILSEGSMDSACTLGAFATTMSGPQPLWSSVIGVGDPGCITSLAYDIADDSSSVVTLTGSAITKYDATTGIFLLSFDVGTAINPGAHYTPVAISLDRDGLYIAVTLASRASPALQTVAVVNTTGNVGVVVGSPIVYNNLGYTSPAHLCPMAHFLISGSDVVTLRGYNTTTLEYSPLYTVGTPNNPWRFVLAATTVDGESDNVYGCMMALLWSDTNNGSVKVDVFGMFNAKHFISYTIAGARAPTGVAMHLQYTVVAVDASPTHAWATAPAASVYLFSAMVSSGPIAVLPTHTNNAHSVDLVVMPFALPPLLKEEQSGVVDQLFVSVVDEGTAELLYMTVPSPYTAA